MPLCPGGRCAAGCDKNRGTVLRVYRIRSLSRHRTLQSRPTAVFMMVDPRLRIHSGQTTPKRPVSTPLLAPSLSPRDELFAGTGTSLLENRLDLREGYLDRIEVRRVRRQEDDASCPRFDQLLNLLTFVGAQIIHDDHLPGLQCRGQKSLNIGLENLGGRRSLHGHRRTHPLNRHACQKGCVLASVAGHTAVGSLPFGSSSIAARHGSVGTAFIYKNELLRIDLPYLLAPASSLLLLAL